MHPKTKKRELSMEGTELIGKRVIVITDSGNNKPFRYTGKLLKIENSLALIEDEREGKIVIPLARIFSLKLKEEVGSH